MKEINEILGFLLDETGKTTVLSLFYETQLQKILFILILISFSISTIFAFFESTKIYSFLFAIILIILLVFFTIAYSITTLKFFYSPIREYVDVLKSRIYKENKLIEELSKKNINDLKIIKEWVEIEIGRIENHINFLVGAIEKLGVIPSVVTLYFAYERYITNKSTYTMYLFFIITMVYIVVIIAKMITNWLSTVHRILLRAEEKSKMRSDLSNVKTESLKK